MIKGHNTKQIKRKTKENNKKQNQRQIKLQQGATDRKVCARERKESKKKNSQRG